MLPHSQHLSASRTHPTLAKPIILINCIHNMVGNVRTKKIGIESKLQGSIGFKTLRIFEACFNILSHHLTQYHETKAMCTPIIVLEDFVVQVITNGSTLCNCYMGLRVTKQNKPLTQFHIQMFITYLASQSFCELTVLYIYTHMTPLLHKHSLAFFHFQSNIVSLLNT